MEALLQKLSQVFSDGSTLKDIPWYYAVLGIVVSIRVVHRLYYVIRGHKHYLFSGFRPRYTMEAFLRGEFDASENDKNKNHDNVDLKNKINSKGGKLHYSERTCRSKKDGVLLKYRMLGNGPNKVYLANGVGTDFFMWFPILKSLQEQYPPIFDEITLVAASYRGLFGSGDRGDGRKEGKEKDNNMEGDIDISIDICADDINSVMEDAGIKKFHTIVGWSLGAQTALTFCSKHDKNVVERLFLLNPSTGKTLHTAMQPFFPAPAFVGKAVSGFIRWGIKYLRPLTYKSWIWDFLSIIAHSFFFRLCLETSAFLGGFPPEQPPYFHEYMYDVFALRMHTRSLLDLIVALDAPLPPTAFTLPQKTQILVGFPDFMTGWYHGKELVDAMPNAKLSIYSMGSHFLLLEWPDQVARELLVFLQSKP